MNRPADSSPPPETPSNNLIEVGWLIAGKFEPTDLEAIEQARERAQSLLQEKLPDFEWQMPMLVREELVKELQVKPTQVLDQGVSESKHQHWDFTIMVTPADLTGIYRKDPLAVFSRALESLLISTSRLDPRTRDPQASRQQRVAEMTQGLLHIALHGIGHLGGLGHSNDRDNIMYVHGSNEPVSFGTTIAIDQLEEIQQHLQEIADRRLEEREGFRYANAILFYATAIWLNQREVIRAIGQARAWEFPFRLSKLTTAAASAVLIMIMTAEVWELGTSQSVSNVTLLSLGTIVATTFYILTRQRVIVHRGGSGFSEQEVLTNVATAGIVLLGIAFTYLFFFSITFVLSLLLFSEALAARWSAIADPAVVPLAKYAVLSAFIAVVGLAIGALGASFEEQDYFRHITLVDEEL